MLIRLRFSSVFAFCILAISLAGCSEDSDSGSTRVDGSGGAQATSDHTGGTLGGPQGGSQTGGTLGLVQAGTDATGGSMHLELCGIAVIGACSDGVVHAMVGQQCTALTVTCPNGCAAHPSAVKQSATGNPDAQSASAAIEAALCESNDGGV